VVKVTRTRFLTSVGATGCKSNHYLERAAGLQSGKHRKEMRSFTNGSSWRRKKKINTQDCSLEWNQLWLS